jgi:hypothetical protein
VTLFGWKQFLMFIGALLVIFIGWNPDARFESSDGIWWDSTVHFKGRSFHTIQSEFQDYRTKCNKPSIRLVRTTAIQGWIVTAWPWYLLKQEWRVPFGQSQKCLNIAARDCRPFGGEVECSPVS